MAVPSTKATLKSYCLRNLGDGVVDINVSDDQVDDRLDEALQYFTRFPVKYPRCHSFSKFKKDDIQA